MNSIVTAVGFFIFIFCAVGVIVNHFTVYENTAYPINIIRSELQLALETHGIEERVKYLDRTGESLEAYSGNSEWWFPKQKTNINLTKELIADISRDVHNQLGVKERENYFFIPHNELVKYLNSETKNIDSRISAYGHSLYWNPDNNLTWYIVAPLGFIGFVTMVIGMCMYGRDEHD